MNTYVVDQFRRQAVVTRNGVSRIDPGGWTEVLRIEATGRASALRQADAKWPQFAGFHRARLVQTILQPRPLCADDRAMIHALTTQTI